jgi:hypothetical protein
MFGGEEMEVLSLPVIPSLLAPPLLEQFNLRLGTPDVVESPKALQITYQELGDGWVPRDLVIFVWLFVFVQRKEKKNVNN